MHRIKNKISVILIVVLLLVGGYYLGLKYPPSRIINIMHTQDGFENLIDDHSLLKRTIDIIENNFYKSIKEEDLIKGMVDSLNDPYSVFYNPEQTKQFNEEIQGKYTGIGIVITKNEDLALPEIVSVFPDSPAKKAGLQKGDIIVDADGAQLVGLSLEEVAMKVKGKSGTEVELKIKRNGETIIVAVKRAEIHIPLVEVNYLNDGKIGYLKINMFSEGVGKQVANIIKEMNKNNVKGIILDLRDNPGGLLYECEKVASQFISSGVLLWTKDREGKMVSLKISGHKPTVPIIVLVNKGTASAAEILAGAIKDYKTGIIIGETTFGKGVIQKIFSLPGEYTLKITVQEYLTPDKKEINKKGVEPDIQLEETEDPLDKALELLEEQ
ncbi:MAG: S41 family peptidase [Caldisericota bacterium]|nr:S41 family peptidase [Caldisericota bacterium]